MQGFSLGQTTLLQDNCSSILLETKGQSSAGKRMRHINIRYFHVKDLVERKRLNVDYCNPKDMVADYFSKPLQGAQFLKFKDQILGKI